MKDWIGSIIWGSHEKVGHLFDYSMIVLILLSVICLTLQSVDGFGAQHYAYMQSLETSIIAIFTIEYVLRIWTSQTKRKYIFSFWGIIDLVAVLPYWLLVFGLTGSGGSSGAARTLRILRLLRLLKLVRYVATIDRLKRAFEIIALELLMFLLLALIIIFIAAVGIYNFEHDAQPEVFASIPHSLWFAVVTLTTVGYGDVYPITTGGKMFTSVVVIVGLGIVAIPTGLIASGLGQAREEQNRLRKSKSKM